MAIGDTGTFTDTRDGQVYTWKIMKNGKKWMTQNFNFKTPNAVYYDNSKANAGLGRLYFWEEANSACPPGWHLPSEDEWQDLAWKEYLERPQLYWPLHKQGDGRIHGNAGFNALKAGLWRVDNGFVGKGESALFLTATLGMSRGTGEQSHNRVYLDIFGVNFGSGTDDGSLDTGCKYPCRYIADE